ncbi:hypothetical protein, partial [Planktomarina sp.]|uniref:hypothetical protein n=1 Tax=Planktomarina sp. TaxID=2024851 RepID=UPI0032609B20
SPFYHSSIGFYFQLTMIKGQVSGTVIILFSQPTFQLNRHCQIKRGLSGQGRFVAGLNEKTLSIQVL